MSHSKPPDLVQVALEKAGIVPSLFVAIRLGLQACGRPGGVHRAVDGGIGRDELSAGAAAVYDGPADLLTLLPDSILGRRRDQ